MIDNTPGKNRGNREISYPEDFFMDQPAEKRYNIKEPGNSHAKVEQEMEKPGAFSPEPAEPISGTRLKQIKKLLKKKIRLYEPLDMKTTLKLFLHWYHQERIATPPYHSPHRSGKECPEVYIEGFLIENAYYALAEEYIQRIIMKRTGISDPHEIKVLDIVDFVREKLEKEGLKKLKSFQEKCKFKTFLTTAVNRLFIDYWRQKRSQEEKVTKYGFEIEQSLHQPLDDPYNVLLKTGDEALKKKAAALLPQVLQRLNYREKLALKLKFEKGLNLSAIARTLGKSRYKTQQWLHRIETRISGEIRTALKVTAMADQQGGHHETSRR
jgi:RNA polymerase sigma factor (sigma-70 family)